MQTCGGLMTAENSLMPNMPKLEIVKLPPMNSSGLSFFARALVAKSLTVDEILQYVQKFLFGGDV